MVSNMSAQIKARAFVRGLERCDHFEKIVKGRMVSRNRATRPILPRELAKDFSHIVSHATFQDSGLAQDMPDHYVEVQVVGHLHTAVVFEQGLEESIVIQNLVA